MAHDRGAAPARGHLVGVKNPPQFRCDTKDCEELARDSGDGCELRTGVNRDGRFAAVVVGQGLERGAVCAPVLNIGKRHLAMSVGPLPERPQSDNPIGVLERQWLHDDGVHDAKDRRAGSDPQCENQNRDHAESGILAETAHSNASVLNQRLPAEHPFITRLILNRGPTPKAACRCPVGALWCHPAIDIRLDFHVKVHVELRAQFLVESIAREERTHPRPPLLHQRHASTARTRAIASTNRCHRDVATTSCFRPDAVSR